MKNLNIENARILGMTFLNLAEASPQDKVDMVEDCFTACGTVACHAGYFALARDLVATDTYVFRDAADDMANFLGFEHAFGLKFWAEANPALWGNPYGYNMFSSRMAFRQDGKQPTLKEIGLHWLAVADRVEGTLWPHKKPEADRIRLEGK